MVSWPSPLVKGVLLKRYKRFLADVLLDTGEEITAHCPNPGSMKSCQKEGWPVYLSFQPHAKRKYPYTLELIHNGRCWICVNTHRANAVVAEALAKRTLSSLAEYDSIQREVKVSPQTRFDFLLQGPGLPPCYLEVKSVSYVDEEGYFSFPDSVTLRGRKHIEELVALRKQGFRTVLLFCIQRTDSTHFRPAAEIDPAYAKTFFTACKQGLDVLAYTTLLDESSIVLDKEIQHIAVTPFPESPTPKCLDSATSSAKALVFKSAAQ